MKEKGLILIIDDEIIIIKALSRALQKEGFFVSSAYDGESGLKKIKEENPDIILLDIIMPKLSGLDVLLKMREAHIQIPVILMTAYGNLETEMKAKELGVVAYLTKPFNSIDDIISLVRSI